MTFAGCKKPVLQNNNSISYRRCAHVRQSIFPSPLSVKGKYGVFSTLLEYVEVLPVCHSEIYLYFMYFILLPKYNRCIPIHLQDVISCLLILNIFYLSLVKRFNMLDSQCQDPSL